MASGTRWHSAVWRSNAKRREKPALNPMALFWLHLSPMRNIFHLSLAVLLLVGCGGTTETIPGTGGTSGSGGAAPGAGGVTPGSGGASGRGGAPPATGGASAGTRGAQVCCLALATCQFG